MQILKNGPDIPDALLAAHEEGRVVFFCGAGISYAADLPDFPGLVEGIYKAVGAKREPIEKEAFEKGLHDATLELLERRLQGNRLAIRKALIKVLRPKWNRKGATTTHEALLMLAQDREGSTRLVTTNFDRIFQRVINRQKVPTPYYPAPMLPIPKNKKWDGVVYLHGLLPTKVDEGALNRLVLTSGDFGLAYLTERWASRFVGELFRNYIVCFVGYSINDPVLRYMMDALAADRRMGVLTPVAYAFADFHPGDEDKKRIEWEAKGVSPILYEVPAGTRDHSAMHDTLVSWAATYRDGIRGMEAIVSRYAMNLPQASTRQDDFVGRMLWALTNSSGLPARRFAEFNPVPSLEWIEPFSDARYQHQDLSRFGIQPFAEIDEELRFSVISRPAPYRLAPWMGLTLRGNQGSGWDPVMDQIARWLCRHLNDPELVLWLVKQGGVANQALIRVIEQKLNEISQLERDGNSEKLEEFRTNAPNSIPSALMRTLWRLLILGRVKSPFRDYDLYHWKDRFRRDGLTPLIRMELRRVLSPRIALRKPYRWGNESKSTGGPEKIGDLVGWDLELSADHVHSALRDFANSTDGPIAFPELVEDLQQLLRDALDLLRELGAADDHSDNSHWDLPSISHHWQNKGFKDWVVLIEFLRDSWLRSIASFPSQARIQAIAWWGQPYPAFKRLALFAATIEGIVAEELWVDWLLMEDAWWLWTIETKRETIRLLVTRGPHLTPEILARVEAAILLGPPRRMFRDTLEPAEWEDLVDRMIWVRLAKLASGGVQLSLQGIERFSRLSEAHPGWELASDQSDEFSHWMSGTGDPGFRTRDEREKAPRELGQLVVWLLKPIPQGPFYSDDWQDVCREDMRLAVRALYCLAVDGQWPVNRWNEALQVWSNDTHIGGSWRRIAPLLRRLPDDILPVIARGIAWWMEAAAKTRRHHHEEFMDLARRLILVDYEASEDRQRPVFDAINHPIGLVTEALFRDWFRDSLEDGQGLRKDLKALFTRLCDPRITQYRNARVILAANLVALFRVDSEWTKSNLLTFFDWNTSPEEAASAWEGFLWSPRLHWSLMEAIKGQFLDSAQHYAELGEYGRQYASVLTYTALDPGGVFTVEDLRDAFEALPDEALVEAIRTLTHALEGAGEKRIEQWKHRVRPFWQTIWPKSRRVRSTGFAEQLAHCTIAAGVAFPAAVATFRDWFQPIGHSHYISTLLDEAGHCSIFPKEALIFLDSIISNQPDYITNEFINCLNDIRRAWPEAETDPRFQRLWIHARRFGQA